MAARRAVRTAKKIFGNKRKEGEKGETFWEAAFLLAKNL